MPKGFPDPADNNNMNNDTPNPYETYILNNYTPEEIKAECARLRSEGKIDLIITIDPNWGDRPTTTKKDNQ